MKSSENILIVLGYPADNNGNPSPILKARLDKAIELYRKGVARKIIVTGAAVDNEFVESEVMAVYLVNNGIPQEDICLLILCVFLKRIKFFNALFWSHICG